MYQFATLNNSKIGRRVGLNLKASSLLENSVKEIKQDKKFIKINESKLASEIIIRFFERYYKKDKDILVKLFFDKKSYLKNIIQNSNSDEELLSSVSQYLNGTKKRGRKKKEVNNLEN